MNGPDEEDNSPGTEVDDDGNEGNLGLRGG